VNAVAVELRRREIHRRGAEVGRRDAGREAAGSVAPEHLHPRRHHQRHRHVGLAVVVPVADRDASRIAGSGRGERERRNQGAVAGVPPEGDGPRAFGGGVADRDFRPAVPVDVADGDPGGAGADRIEGRRRERSRSVVQGNRDRPDLLVLQVDGDRVEVAVAVHVGESDLVGRLPRVVGGRELKLDGRGARHTEHQHRGERNEGGCSHDLSDIRRAAAKQPPASGCLRFAASTSPSGVGAAG
jgi:hypothetical protein